MKACFYALFALLNFCVLAAPLYAQPNAVSQPEFSTLNGGWVISYNDHQAGLVQGRAYFDVDIDYGTVTFQLPDGAAQTLRAQSVSVQGDALRVVWTADTEGVNPNFHPVGQPVNSAGNSFTLKLGESTHEARLGTPPGLDQTIISDLVYNAANDSLAGTWTQSVDALTAQSGGANRVGFFEFGASNVGGAMMTGSEAWSRPVPEIKDAFVIRPQFAMGLLGPAYPYPFNTGSEVDVYDTKRYVFVYGKNLPHRRGERIEITSEDDKVEYYVYALKSTYERDGARADRELLDRALERVDLTTQQEKPRYEREPGDDFMILEATLKPGVLPGYKGLAINDVDTAWTLRFGDHRATIAFARDLTIDLEPQLRANAIFETELTDLVYTPEEIIVELYAETELPFDEFQILIGKNGKQLKFGDQLGITVKKDTERSNSRVYRSPPIHLIAPGTEALYPTGTLMVPTVNGDTLHARLGGAPILDLSSALTNVKVLDKPSNLLKIIEGEAAPEMISWRGALLKSASCAGIDNPEGYSDLELARKEADDYSDVVISNIWRDVETILNTRIKVGEHAGTIALRPVFRSMLKSAEAVYAEDLADEATAGLRSTLRQAVTKGDHPLSKIMVKDPRGEELFLSLTFYDDYLDEKYDLRGDERLEYQITAMREARRKLLAEIKGAIEKIDETDECDVKDMLYLTGFGTDVLRRRTYASLMKLKTITEDRIDAGGAVVPTSRTQWVANRQARAHVSNVALYAQTLKEQERVSDDEWDNYLLTLSLMSIPIGIGAEILAIESVVYATAVLDFTDLALNIVQESSKQYAESVELEFARGARVAIGDARLHQAIRDDSSALVSYIKTAGSFIQVGFAVKSIGSAAEMQRSIIRGNRTTKRIFANRGVSNLEEFNKLSPRAQKDVYRTIISAMHKETDLGRRFLNPDELRALNFERMIYREELIAGAIGPVRPAWAQGLTSQAISRLDDMVTRLDIQRLVSENARVMNRLLMDDDVLDILRLPQDSLQNLERAVARHRNRAPTRGPAFVDQAAPANGNPEGLYFRTQTALEDGETTVVSHVYAGQSDSGVVYGQFVRARTSDTVFDTGKDFFVFDMAQANRMALPDELLATPGKFVPGSPRLDMPQLREQVLSAPGSRYRAGPRWVQDVQVPLRDGGPGVPFVMWGNMHTYKALGFSYADPQAAGIMLKNVLSANTIGELSWLRHTYPTKSVDELFRYTLSYRYAQNTAEQLGFRISEVKVVGAVPGEPGFWGASYRLDELVNQHRWFDPGGARTIQEAEAAKQKFIETYTIPGNPKLPQSFNVYLKFEAL